VINPATGLARSFTFGLLNGRIPTCKGVRLASAADDWRKGAGLRFGLLGPLAAWRAGGAVELGSPQQRLVLALLLLRRNELVSADVLVDGLWGDVVPPNGLQAVRTYVSRLRKLLSAGGGSPLAGEPGGYRLRVGAGELDVERFEALAARGRAALTRGRPAEGQALLESALALLRGRPLEGLEDLEAARFEQERLQELRLLVEEDAVEARLARGFHQELVPELRARVAEMPERERSWAQLMLALYRSGRQTEALAAYREARSALGDRLGLEPGRELRRLERLILLQEEALDHDAVGRLHGVPRRQTSLHGREKAINDLCAVLRRSRLVSLVGPAGVGKTRLAVEAALRLRPTFPDGIWWVDLSAADATAVPAAFARALALRDSAGGLRVEDLVVARLRGAQMLVIVDNCEHVVETAAALLGRALAETAAARLLATSREPLRIAGEVVQAVRPLPTPTETSLDRAELLAYDAVQLFLARSDGAFNPERLDEADAAAIVDVLERLDGLPLALELAAARLRSLSASELARSLEQRLGLLSDGDRTAPARHRTLEAAIDWSYALLTADEQRTLACVAVFPGDFGLEAAAAVAADRPAMRDAVPRLLSQLVDKSMLTLETGGNGRYRLLQTVRAFVLRRAAGTREPASAARRHRDHFTALGEQLRRGLLEPKNLSAWLDLGHTEQDNLRAALFWSLEHADGEPALQLASSLCVYWYRTSQLNDGLELLGRALDLAPVDSRWRPRAVMSKAHLQLAAGIPDAATTASAAVAACEHADPELLGLALAALGQARAQERRFDEADAAICRAHRIFAELAFPEGLHFTDELLGVSRHLRGDLDGALHYLLRSRDGYFEMRGSAQAGWTHIHLARVQLALGLLDDAETSARTGIEEFRQRHDPRGIAAAFTCLGQTHTARNDPARARLFLDEAHTLARRWSYPLETADAEAALRLLSTA
jgi:predicted ATPase/DNA-binding SARP family transcriptional activator